MEQEYSAAGNNTSTSLFFENKGHVIGNFYTQAGLTIVYVLIFLICFAGNLAVILVVTLQWKARLLSKFYLGNLAAANLSVGAFCVPQSLSVYLLDRWIFGELMCKMFHGVTSLCHTVSILSLVVVSIERYLALLHPFRGPPVLTVQRVKVALLIVWVLSTAVSLPIFFSCGLVQISTNEKGITGEICVPTRSMYNSSTADMVYFIMLFALPLAALSIMYLRFGAHIRKYEQKRSEVTKNVLQSKVVSEGNSDAVQHADSVAVGPCVWLSSTPSSSAEVTGEDLRDSKLIIKDGLCNCQIKTLGFHRFEIQRSQLRLSRRRKRKSLVRMLTSIVVTFALLNLPFHVRKLCVNFLPSFDLSSDVNNVITQLTLILLYVNCAVNPTLFVLMSGRFRQSLKELVRKFGRASECISVSL